MDGAAPSTGVQSSPPSGAWMARRFIPLGVAAVIFLAGVPLARERFMDFGVALPAMTLALIKARSAPLELFGGAGGTGSGVHGPLRLVARLASLAVLGVLGVLGVVGRRRWVGHAVLWTGIALAVFQAVALAVPLVQMWRSLRGA